MSDNYLMHGGPGSGRYPKGSGERPYQHDSSGKSYKDMTDEELQAINKRDALERTYERNHPSSELNVDNTINSIQRTQQTQNTLYAKHQRAEKEKRDDEIDKMKLDDMSEAEMMNYINRKRIERQYKDTLKYEADNEAKRKGSSITAKIAKGADIALDGLVIGMSVYKLYKLLKHDGFDGAETFDEIQHSDDSEDDVDFDFTEYYNNIFKMANIKVPEQKESKVIKKNNKIVSIK